MSTSHISLWPLNVWSFEITYQLDTFNMTDLKIIVPFWRWYFADLLLRWDDMKWWQWDGTIHLVVYIVLFPLGIDECCFRTVCSIFAVVLVSSGQRFSESFKQWLEMSDHVARTRRWFLQIRLHIEHTSFALKCSCFACNQWQFGKINEEGSGSQQKSYLCPSVDKAHDDSSDNGNPSCVQ